MRCNACHSYIPEGLPEPVICPQCGRTATAPAPVPPPLPGAEPRLGPTKPELAAEPGAEPPSAAATELAEPSLQAPSAAAQADNPQARLGLDNAPPPHAAQDEEPFAPFFTIKLRLAYGPAAASLVLRNPTDGSVSFGPEGFSIVFDEGLHWERVHYRDLTSARVHDDSVVLSLSDSENRLTLYHGWLPNWLAGPRRARAAVFVELLARVRSGLTPYEVSLFRRRLQ